MGAESQIAEQIREEFDVLQKKLALVLPSLTGILIALLTGAGLVEFGSYAFLPQNASTIVLAFTAFAYYQCFRATRGMMNLADELSCNQGSAGKQQLEQTKLILQKKSSLFNPFSTQTDSAVDYLGILLMAFQPFAVMIIAAYTFSIENRQIILAGSRFDIFQIIANIGHLCLDLLLLGAFVIFVSEMKDLFYYFNVDYSKRGGVLFLASIGFFFLAMFAIAAIGAWQILVLF